MGALILYSIEYKIEAPMIDGSLDCVFTLIHFSSYKRGPRTSAAPFPGTFFAYEKSIEYKIDAPTQGGGLCFVFN